MTAPSYQPGFFIWICMTPRVARRCFTAALTGRLPSGDALKTEYARALARITDSELNTEEGIRVVDEGALLATSRSKRLVDDSVERSAYRAEARALARRQIEAFSLAPRLASITVLRESAPNLPAVQDSPAGAAPRAPANGGSSCNSPALATRQGAGAPASSTPSELYSGGDVRLRHYAALLRMRKPFACRCKRARWGAAATAPVQ